MRKPFWGVTVFWFCSLVISLVPVQAREKLILRCADVQAFGYPTVKGVLYMSRLVKEQTDGRIEIVVYPDSLLGSESSVVEMVRLGALEMGRVSVTQVAEVAPEFGVFILPYLFKDNVHKWRVLDGVIGKRMLTGLGKVGLIGLGFQEAGYRSFYNSKHPINRPEDLKGLRIRVQPNEIMVNFMEFLGAYPVPIHYDGVAAALEAKVIDGAENNIPSYFASGHCEQAAYYSFDRHNSIPEIMIMSQQTWSGLQPADRRIIVQAARQAAAYQRRLWLDFERQCLEKLIKSGSRFNEVDKESFWRTGQLFIKNHASEYQRLVGMIKQAGA